MVCPGDAAITVEPQHPNRARNQPWPGASGMVGARRDPTGCDHRRTDHSSPFAGSSFLPGAFHSAFPPLLALFLLTFSATKFGRSKKVQLGVAEDDHGRNAAQVAANLGVAGVAAAAAISLPSLGPWYAVAVMAGWRKRQPTP